MDPEKRQIQVGHRYVGPQTIYKILLIQNVLSFDKVQMTGNA